MGSNGSFAIGQLNAAGTIDYDIVPPLLGTDGKRHTPLSTNGYVMSASERASRPGLGADRRRSIAPAFLESTWGKPGHAVPARRSAASSVIDTSHAPANQKAILEAMEVGAVFRPYTAGARAAYDRTIDLFTKMNTGALPIPDALAQIEAAANERARGRPGAVILGRGRPGSVARRARPPTRPEPAAGRAAGNAGSTCSSRPGWSASSRSRSCRCSAPVASPSPTGSRRSHRAGSGSTTSPALAADPRFGTAVVNTLVYGIATVVPGLAIGLGLALLLGPLRRGGTVLRTTVFMPAVVAGVATALMWGWIFNPRFGLIDGLLGDRRAAMGRPGCATRPGRCPR